MIKKGYPPIDIDFNRFKKQLKSIFFNKAKSFSINDFNEYYKDYKDNCYCSTIAHILAYGYISVEDWGNEFFQDWNINDHEDELLIDHPELGRWIQVKRREPNLNEGVIICIPYEDNELVFAMLDRDKDGKINWINLYTYEILYPLDENKILKWMISPEIPENNEEEYVDDELEFGKEMLLKLREERKK